jgi:LemA protein
MSTVTLVIIVVVALLLLALWVSTYSRIAALGSQIDLAAGTLAAQLQQRHDLIPDVLKAAKEAVKAQMQALDGILAVRRSLSSDSRPPAEAFDVPPELRALTATAQNAGRGRPVHEDNPQIDVKTYEKLQEVMQSTEKDVAGARRFLQAAISQYNAAVRSFPGALVASVHGFAALPTAKVTPQLEHKPNYWPEDDSRPALDTSPREAWKLED